MDAAMSAALGSAWTNMLSLASLYETVRTGVSSCRVNATGRRTVGTDSSRHSGGFDGFHDGDGTSTAVESDCSQVITKRTPSTHSIPIAMAAATPIFSRRTICSFQTTAAGTRDNTRSPTADMTVDDSQL